MSSNGTTSGFNSGSALKDEPAQLVAQPLIVQHEFSDGAGELRTLPFAFTAAGRLAVA